MTERTRSRVGADAFGGVVEEFQTGMALKNPFLMIKGYLFKTNYDSSIRCGSI